MPSNIHQSTIDLIFIRLSAKTIPLKQIAGLLALCIPLGASGVIKDRIIVLAWSASSFASRKAFVTGCCPTTWCGTITADSSGTSFEVNIYYS